MADFIFTESHQTRAQSSRFSLRPRSCRWLLECKTSRKTRDTVLVLRHSPRCHLPEVAMLLPLHRQPLSSPLCRLLDLSTGFDGFTIHRKSDLTALQSYIESSGACTRSNSGCLCEACVLDMWLLLLPPWDRAAHCRHPCLLFGYHFFKYTAWRTRLAHDRERTKAESSGAES